MKASNVRIGGGGKSGKKPQNREIWVGKKQKHQRNKNEGREGLIESDRTLSADQEGPVRPGGASQERSTCMQCREVGRSFINTVFD